MGRIQKAINKLQSAPADDRSRKKIDSDDSRYYAADPKILVPDVEPQFIDFAKLPTLRPDPELLIQNRIVAAQPDAPARTVYKILRTRVLQRMRAARWNILGISGSGPGEGKTLTAVNLAFSLAHDLNYRVILVDLDLRRPSLHKYLGIEKPRFDLEQYRQNKATLKQLLLRPGEQRLAVITNTTAHRDSSEVLSSPKLAKFVEELRSLGTNTITVCDLPPVLAGDDVLAFAPLIDALLLVVAEGVCKRENLTGIKDLLGDTEIIGTVLNRSRERSSSVDYYDYY